MYEDIYCHGAPGEVKQFRPEWQLYESLHVPDAGDNTFDVVCFCKQNAPRLPLLTIGEAWLAFAGTSTEVERTFRTLAVLLTPLRRRMKENTITCRLSFMLNGDLLNDG